jgi:hypothetical protein
MKNCKLRSIVSDGFVAIWADIKGAPIMRTIGAPVEKNEFFEGYGEFPLS